MSKHTVGGLAQSVECVVSNDEAPGSKPGFSIVFGCETLTFEPKNATITSSGIRTRNPRIRSPMRYPLRHGGINYDPGGTRTHNR